MWVILKRSHWVGLLYGANVVELNVLLLFGSYAESIEVILVLEALTISLPLLYEANMVFKPFGVSPLRQRGRVGDPLLVHLSKLPLNFVPDRVAARDCCRDRRGSSTPEWIKYRILID